MAKIKFGMMMTDARGKLGGQVFSKNRSGAYVRTKVTPVNPQTSYQQNSRAILGNLSASWSGLTEEQRTRWNNAVEEWKKTDIFGDLKTPTGKNLFTGLNKNNVQAGNPILLEPPTKVDFPVVSITGANLGIDGGEIAGGDFETFGNTTGFKMLVRATPVLSQGTSFIKNRLRVVGYFTGGENSTPDWYEEYIARFGSAMQVGANVWVELRLVATTGQVSAPVIAKANVYDAS